MAIVVVVNAIVVGDATNAKDALCCFHLLLLMQLQQPMMSLLSLLPLLHLQSLSLFRHHPLNLFHPFIVPTIAGIVDNDVPRNDALNQPFQILLLLL